MPQTVVTNQPTIHAPITGESMDKFLAHMNKFMLVHNMTNFPTLEPTVLAVAGGRKYIKIVCTRMGKPESVYCFVDAATGKIMRAASYKAPEPKKYERANVNNPETWGNCGPYGLVYMRG